MLGSGIHLAPSQFEAMFLSAAHTDQVIEETLDAVEKYFREENKAFRQDELKGHADE